jgi:hypothetical protein
MVEDMKEVMSKDREKQKNNGRHKERKEIRVTRKEAGADKNTTE